MRKTMVALVLLAGILGVGIYENTYLDNTIKNLEQNLTVLEQTLNDEDLESSEKILNEMAKYWQNQNTFLEVVSYSQNLRNVSLDISETLGCVMAQDVKSAIARLYVLKRRLIDLKETIGISPSSII